MSEHIVNKVSKLLQGNNAYSSFLARQWLMMTNKLSTVVETYLYDNEGRMQNLQNFENLRFVYDNLPRKLLLKCSRKTLKSTLLSNVICLNMIRYPHYKMLYIAPQEISTKYFSNNYLNARFNSKPLLKIFSGINKKDIFLKNDVFEKELALTNSQVLLRYCSDDATRIRGPAVDHNILDEVQDMDLDVLPIIKETLALSKVKREIFAGTPLTTDNTINVLWKNSNQGEWAMKCTSCSHWNTLTEDNEPLKMILPQGLSCSKCSALIDSNNGMWVEFSPKSESNKGLIGYHLAQPILKQYNEDPKEWLEVYNKVHNSTYRLNQIYNEVFGLAVDTGTKLISREFLENKACALGEMDKIFEKNKNKYLFHTCGVDWGVNMETSRTVMCVGGLREDGIYEVFYIKVFKNMDYDSQIREIAKFINNTNSFCAADSGPDPNRGIRLMQLTSYDKTQLVRYEAGHLKQRYMIPVGSMDPTQNRWCLHRSDTMGFTLELLKNGKILLPRWEDCEDAMTDILNIFVEYKEGQLRQEVHYRHKPDQPDDFFHALNFAACQAHLLANNPILFTGSSTSEPVSLD